MEEFKLEYTEPDKVYETVDTIKEKPLHRYYEIEVSRRQIAYVTVRVPYEKELNFRNSHAIAVEAVDDLVRSYDWETEYGDDIEVESIKEMTEDEATEYDFYESD